MSVPATARHRQTALATGLFLLLVPLLSLPVILRHAPVIQVFIPMWGTLACTADLLTAYLLFGQFSGTRAPSQAALAGTYLFSAILTVSYMLTFPGVFAPAGLLHAGPQTTVWLWICLHTGFLLGLLCYALIDARWGHIVLTTRTARRLFWALTVLVPLFVVLLTCVIISYDSLLPVMIQGMQFLPLFSITSPFGIGLCGLSLAVLTLLMVRLRLSSIVQLWLIVVALAYVLDITLSLLVRSRYTIGWYESRLNTVVASIIVLGVLLYEISQLYANLAQSEAGLRDLMESAPIGMSIADGQGVITGVNPSYLVLVGYGQSELIGHQLSEIFPARTWPPNGAGHSAATGTREWQLQMKGGTLRTVLEREVTLAAPNHQWRYVSFVLDITERKQTEEHLAHLAHHDPLTGLPNRVLFHERLTEALQVAARHTQLLALLFLDLDGFKAINDTHGHGIGDILLQTVAERLTRCVRESDTVARLGGDEFTIILPMISQSQGAAKVAQKILLEFDQPLLIGRHSVEVTTSIGIAFGPDDARDSNALLQLADLAMYAAKALGRNRFMFYSQAQSIGGGAQPRGSARKAEVLARQSMEDPQSRDSLP
jgi:diguanylate cyclase (GGDEF)-like protein/PAS domain S-box-containing protein